MKLYFKTMILSMVVVSISCAVKNSVKVSDFNGQNCPPGSAPVEFINKGKKNVGCYKCPDKTVANYISKTEGMKCGDCPKGMLMKKREKLPGIISSGEDYYCSCSGDNSYAVSQPDLSVKCFTAPKDKNVQQEMDLKITGDKQYVIYKGPIVTNK